MQYFEYFHCFTFPSATLFWWETAVIQAKYHISKATQLLAEALIN